MKSYYVGNRPYLYTCLDRPSSPTPGLLRRWEHGVLAVLAIIGAWTVLVGVVWGVVKALRWLL